MCIYYGFMKFLCVWTCVSLHLYVFFSVLFLGTFVCFYFILLHFIIIFRCLFAFLYVCLFYYYNSFLFSKINLSPTIYSDYYFSSLKSSQFCLISPAIWIQPFSVSHKTNRHPCLIMKERESMWLLVVREVDKACKRKTNKLCLWDWRNHFFLYHYTGECN